MRNSRNYSKVLPTLVIALIVLMSHSSEASDLITPRSGHSTTLLQNGKVLIAGGFGTIKNGRLSNPISSAELYDPGTATWSRTGNLSTSRVEFTATLLRNGKVLVVGGSSSGGPKKVLNTAELYDPATGTWNPTGNLNTARWYHTATLLKNGRVLVAGGTGSSAELYNPDTGTWSRTGDLNTDRSFNTATLLLNGKVLAVEGYGAGVTAELYDPATGTWSLTGNLSKSYYWHTATLLPNGKVLVVGSLYFETSRTTELYDPDTGTWILTGPLNVGRLYHAAVLLSKGKVLVLGGADHPTNTFTPTVEIYEPNNGTWKHLANLKTSRSSAATLLQNGKVLVIGGWNASGGLISDELYKAPIRLPKISSTSTSGKKLFVFGKNFEPGAVILLNGKEQITAIDDQSPTTTLIGKKAGKRIKLGDKLQVRNLNGTLSKQFTFSD